MPIKWKPIIITIILVNVVVVSYLLFIYFDNKKVEKEKQEELAALQAEHVVEELTLAHDILKANNLEEMIEAADTIVLGSYGEFINTLSLSETQEDESKIKLETKLHQFQVEDVLKGDLTTKDIKVNHIYTMLFPIEDYYEDENVYTNHTHTVKHNDPTYIKPEKGDRYILFLTADEKEGFYTKAIEPAMIKVKADDTVTLTSNIIGPADGEQGTLYHVDDNTAFRVSVPSIPDFEDNISNRTLDELISIIKK